MINKEASFLEQARQAVQIKNDLMISARNAMADGNAAAQLGMTAPLRTFDELVAARSREYSGDALYKQVIADAEVELKTLRGVTDPGGCFIAGTLVHTKEGLKPIEEIKVGDYVLSKPEDGKGEQAYKRVAKTLQFEEKEVWCVDILPKSEREQAKREGRHLNEDAGFYFVVTPNHPFWVKGLGWTRADELYARYREDDPGFYPVEVELENGEAGLVMHNAVLYKTTVDQDIAWLPACDIDVVGWHLDLGKNRTSVEHRGQR
ncbi:MAG: hypothetical protein LBQ81_13225 [Zoogloeaceae bacterium]|jgi:hypothetical protein|nr:hypothetical protein [Zoogloeaceae bacterium]